MKVEPRVLSGFKDRLPNESIQKNKMLEILKNIFESFGFLPIETPHIEYADILLSNVTDENKKEIYKFSDHGNREVALRFDQTIPLARFIAQHKEKLGLPFKRYVMGNVFRGERAQKGRYREFMQCDFDFVGSRSLNCDAEIIQVIYHALKALGCGDFTIFINHRKVLEGICKYFKIQNIDETLRIIDKLEKIGEYEVEAKLRQITPNAKELISIINMKQTSGDKEFFTSIQYLKKWNEELKQGIEELEYIYKILSNLIDENAYKINFAIARGLAYYTGIVYESVLDSFNIGSVCSGGRYDNLASNFCDENISGVGASIGIDRLLSVIDLNLERKEGLIICLENRFFAFAYEIASFLRERGLKIEVFPEAKKLKKQLSYANARGYRFVLIIGEEEFQNEKITLKDLDSSIQKNNIDINEVLNLINNEKNNIR